MSPNDIATVGYIDGSQRLLLAELAALRAELLAVASRPADEYLSIPEVCAATSTSRKTVERWIEVGKPGPNGQLVKLPTFKFGEHVRIKRADLEAFGKVHEQVGAAPARAFQKSQPQAPAAAAGQLWRAA